MAATLVAPASFARSDSSRAALWTGRVLTGLAVVFLAFDTGFKFVTSPEAVTATAQLGWRVETMPILAAIEAICLVLYLIPRTAPIGALLWTGYLGGAIATHLRIGNPLLTHTLFPIYVALLIWGGLYLRDARVRNCLRAAR